MASAFSFLVIFFAHAHAAQMGVNPVSNVIGLLGDLKAKIQAEGAEELQEYGKYVKWCKKLQNALEDDISTDKIQKGKEEAVIEKSTDVIADADAKIETRASEISEGEAELQEATQIREKERATFLASEKELVDVLDTIDRAAATLKASPASLAQISKHSAEDLVSALGLMAEAASLSALERQKLISLAQTHTTLGEESWELGSPAGAVYESRAGSVLELLEDLKEKATAQLSDLRKAEGAAEHEFNVLRQSLKKEAEADARELKEEKTIKGAASEEKADSESELAVILQELPEDERHLEKVVANCERKEANHEATAKSREEELKAVSDALKVLTETAGGAAKRTYSLLQLRATSQVGVRLSSDADHVQALALVRRLAEEHQSAALAQLASQMTAVMSMGVAAGLDPFAKIKGLIRDLISKMENEAAAASTEKAYCDEEMAKTSERKDELATELDSITSKLDKSANKVAELKDQVAELQSELSALASSQSEMDKIRKESHDDYAEAKKDLEDGLTGIRKALSVLREYYSQGAGSAAMLQVEEMPESHEKSSGAGAGIISMLEVCESDIADTLAKEEAEESEALEEYEKTTQENKVSIATKSSAVQLKTKKYKSLEKSITDHKGDRDGLSSELDAVAEYETKMKDRCIGKPDSYAERKDRQEAEAKGLKEALKLLSAPSFTQRGRLGFHRASQLSPSQS